MTMRELLKGGITDGMVGGLPMPPRCHTSGMPLWEQPWGHTKLICVLSSASLSMTNGNAIITPGPNVFYDHV